MIKCLVNLPSFCYPLFLFLFLFIFKNFSERSIEVVCVSFNVLQIPFLVKEKITIFLSACVGVWSTHSFFL